MRFKSPATIWQIFALYHAAHAHGRDLDHEAHGAHIRNKPVEMRRVF